MKPIPPSVPPDFHSMRPDERRFRRAEDVLKDIDLKREIAAEKGFGSVPVPPHYVRTKLRP